MSAHEIERRVFLGGVAALGGACLGLSGCAASTRCPEPASPSPGPARVPQTAPVAAPTRARSELTFPTLRGFCDGVPAVTGVELEERRERAKRLLKGAGLGALIVEAGPTHGYFAPTRWGQSERPLLMIIPADGAPTWVGPAFEERRLVERLGPGARLLTWQEDVSPYAKASEALKLSGVGRTAKVAVDPGARGFVIAGLQSSLGARRVTLGGDIVDGCRMLKGSRELARLRRANEATKAALREAATRLKPGMHEDEFAAVVRAAQQEAGLTDIWALVLFGPNASFPHGTDERRALREDELVLVDTGGALHGYRSDITRTWSIGPVSDELRRAWDTTLQAQSAALAAIRPGVRCAEVDAAARDVITRAGYGEGFSRFTHRLGHGIGLQVHEAPYLRPGNQRALAPGMTMSDEPGIYEPGRFGVRIEDIVAVTEDGAEVFGPRALSLLEAPFGA